MPQFALLALAGAALYGGYKLALKALDAEAQSMKTAAAKPRRPETQGSPKDLGALEWDEVNGVYRPRD